MHNKEIEILILWYVNENEMSYISLSCQTCIEIIASISELWTHKGL